jgi:class 3 adenylate cyclase
MRCSNCGSDNPDGLKFCNQCGTALQLRCAKCGFNNAAGSLFCGECGASLNTALAASPGSQPRAEALPRRSGERRHLTVLFCDLVGSTEMAARLDPEEWRETVATYHRSAADAIGRFGGCVAKYLGDGVMAYFGHPQAHDNDAERAIRAGLAILEALPRLLQHPSRPKLSARIGIDSGPVVVGTGAGTEIEVFGEAPNIAARVQAAAAPNTVLISAATHRLVVGLFVVEDCEAQTLKGVEQPLQLYRVMRPTGVRGRLEAAAASHGLTPFVGREEELRLLNNRWQRVLDGEGQMVALIGEAGIGKSRLVQQFHQQITGTPQSWIGGAAAPFYQNTPFYPIVEALWQVIWKQTLDRFGDYLGKLKNERETGAEAESVQPPSPGTHVPNEGGVADPQLTELQSGLARAGIKTSEAIPLIAPLFHLQLTGEYTPSTLPPEQQHRRLLATLIEWLLGTARAQPLVILIEDLHWADPSTLELIQLLLEQGATARMLLVYTARPEFHPDWPLRAHHTQITLNRLNARDVREMIAHVAAQNALANETLDTVVERTSGIPLFIEELTRAVLESGNVSLSSREIPVTLHDSLMARLDRLGSAKEVLQIGSVIGGEFSYQLLLTVHSLSDDELQRELRRLTEADMLYVRGLAPDAIYQFRHVLIRDAAYEALLKSRRKELHRLVAVTIEEKFPAVKEAHPEVLARHWTEAGEIEKAIAEWQIAGKAAKARNAFIEARGSYEQALALLNLLPESHERDLHELELRQSHVAALQLSAGSAAPETIEASARARALAEKTGNLTQSIRCC